MEPKFHAAHKLTTFCHFAFTHTHTRISHTYINILARPEALHQSKNYKFISFVLVRFFLYRLVIFLVFASFILYDH